MEKGADLVGAWELRRRYFDAGPRMGKPISGGYGSARPDTSSPVGCLGIVPGRSGPVERKLLPWDLSEVWESVQKKAIERAILREAVYGSSFQDNEKEIIIFREYLSNIIAGFRGR